MKFRIGGDVDQFTRPAGSLRLNFLIDEQTAAEGIEDIDRQANPFLKLAAAAVAAIGLASLPKANNPVREQLLERFFGWLNAKYETIANEARRLASESRLPFEETEEALETVEKYIDDCLWEPKEPMQTWILSCLFRGISETMDKFAAWTQPRQTETPATPQPAESHLQVDQSKSREHPPAKSLPHFVSTATGGHPDHEDGEPERQPAPSPDFVAFVSALGRADLRSPNMAKALVALADAKGQMDLADVEVIYKGVFTRAVQKTAFKGKLAGIGWKVRVSAARVYLEPIEVATR